MTILSVAPDVISAVELGPVFPGDVEHVAEHIREADRVEVYEGTRREVYAASLAAFSREKRPYRCGAYRR